MTRPSMQPAWQTLKSQAESIKPRHLDKLFAQNPQRAEQMGLEALGLYFDYSKQRLTPKVLDTLIELAEQQDLEGHRKALFAGEVINTTERRAAWHTALRAPRPAVKQGLSAVEVHEVLSQIEQFVSDVRSGYWRGHSGLKIANVVNIGIGGSDLGPRLVYQALAGYNGELKAHFVANVDPDELDDILYNLNPATTLFIVTSKSFKTPETLVNARAAKRWLQMAGVAQANLAKHFVAVTANKKAAADFGIRQVFSFWDWVSGRYSLWSAVGLSIALTLGMDSFRQLLAGAHAMDQHFLGAPLAKNLPVVLALIGIWNRNFLDLPGHIVVPYAQRLVYFPEWLQQLSMESNGKGVTRHGEPVGVATAPMVWGTVGTNAQHAYFQMLHQASLAADIDFILPIPSRLDEERVRHQVANCLAQSEALMSGRTAQSAQPGAQPTLAAARHFDGNRPSSTLLLPKLDAWHLGALLATYEHKTFVQGVIWDINSFDQWGVELGKTLAQELVSGLEQPAEDNHNSSTQNLLKKIQNSACL